jgi:beta-lactamase class A
MSLLFDKTQSLLETIAYESAGLVGVHAFDPDDPDMEFTVNADHLFPTASIIKVPILLEFYNQVAAGELDPDEVHGLNDDVKVGGSGVLQFLSDETQLTLEDWAKLMINLSDNTATNYMIDVVGIENVNNLLEHLGLEKTKLVRKMQAGLDPDKVENLTTPREFSRLMMMIKNHYSLDAEVCEKTLDVLKLYKDGIIFETLPKDLVVADKSGWMGGVQCDSGIVYAEKPYIVTVMASHIPAWDRNGYETRENLKQMVSEIHDYYSNKATTSQYGRRG